MWRNNAHARHTRMLDPGAANSRILVKIRESCALLAIPQTPTHPIRAKPIRITRADIVAKQEAQLDSLRLPDERKHGTVHPTQGTRS
jgi:hypothetical protein